jgi:hypothetical protein
MNTKDLVCLCLEQFAMDSIIKFDRLRCKIAGGGGIILTSYHFLGLQVLLAILKGFTLNLFLFLF